MPPRKAAIYYLLSFLDSHCWLAMPQLVLQADWQEVWHSPHPPFFALWQRFLVSIVLICFIDIDLQMRFYFSIITHEKNIVNSEHNFFVCAHTIHQAEKSFFANTIELSARVSYN